MAMDKAPTRWQGEKNEGEPRDKRRPFAARDSTEVPLAFERRAKESWGQK